MLPGGLTTALATPAKPQPTQELKIAIQALHDAIAKETEPEDKATIATCLQSLLKLQAKNMAETRSGGAGGASTPPRGLGALPQAPGYPG